jgi:hypothetical protein
MRKRSYRLLGVLALAAVGLSAACTTSSTTVVDTEYENCVLGDACTGDTTCTTTEFTSGTGTGSMCTASCSTGSDCPADPNFQDIDCVINAGETVGQCYIDCTSAGPAACEDGTQCAALDNVSICVP